MLPGLGPFLGYAEQQGLRLQRAKGMPDRGPTHTASGNFGFERRSVSDDWTRGFRKAPRPIHKSGPYVSSIPTAAATEAAQGPSSVLLVPRNGVSGLRNPFESANRAKLIS